ELGDAARTVADDFAAVAPEDRHRTGRRSDGSNFTVESLAAYYIHDPIHHLWDVRG
ncbi:MAG: DinB family protein, partial [Rhodococcus sp. (in: high G+C Gram-positive bacteria)]